MNLILGGYNIIGSLVGTVAEMQELVQLAADGKVKTHIGRTTKLSGINEVLDELQNAQYTGRAIINDMAN